MLVTDANNVQVLRFPEPIYAPDPSFDPNTGEYSQPLTTGYDPVAPEFLPLAPWVVDRLLAGPVEYLSAIEPWRLDQGTVDTGWEVSSSSDFRVSWVQQAIPSLFVGTALWVLIGWWLASGRAGGSLRRLALPLATATTTAFLIQPLSRTGSVPLTALAGIMVALGMLPLADGLAAAVEDARERTLVRYAAVVCASAAAGLAIAAAASTTGMDVGVAAWALTGAIALIPGLAAAGPIRSEGIQAAGVSSGRLLQSTEYAVVGATPMVALVSTTSAYVLPLLVWFAMVMLAGRFTVRPLARLASRATLQRDLVVAATEAERARVAADIHDDALQDLTLLVHRLDAAGDTEGADMVRTVSDRLRAICGDLRLPILDDLGVGPALDWLVLRIERLAGGEVRLERSDGTRPPPEVELAFFRVAQEALANAVKHGRPPIIVRYTTTATGASLSIDDDGPGIEPDVVGAAERPGHFGLLNMQQRAEGIGAILDVRRWPAGGTHVALEWRSN
jgi:signal transduction histidine kinase